MSVLAFFQLRLDKFPLGTLEQILPEAVIKGIGQSHITAEIPPFQHRCANGEILCPQPQAFAQAARRMANF